MLAIVSTAISLALQTFSLLPVLFSPFAFSVALCSPPLLWSKLRASLNIALVNQLCSSNTIPQTSAPVRILQGQSRRCYEPHSLWMRGENHSPGLPKAKGFSLGGPGAAPGTQGRSIGLGMNTIHSIITTDVTRRSKNCALTPVKVKFVPGTRSFYCSDSSPIG